MTRSTPYDDPRLRAARALGETQGAVLSRPQLYDLGITRWMVAGEVRARRWRRVGDQSLCLHNGPIEAQGHWWAAVFQGGPRAVLDGASSLVAGGLERFEVERVRVSVPRGARIRRTQRYDIRQTRRWAAADRVESGIPRTRTEVAAVRGALWAVTDRQATYLLTAAVQQGLVAPEDLGRELLRVRRDKRRLLLHEVVNDLVDGGRALGELDVARELRRRGLPARVVRSSAETIASATTSTSTGPSGAWSSRSTASITPGPRTSSVTPSARTPSSWPATRSSVSRCSGSGSGRTTSSRRSRKHSAGPATVAWPDLPPPGTSYGRRIRPLVPYDAARGSPRDVIRTVHPPPRAV